MLNAEAIERMIEQITDPFLHKSLLELNSIKDLRWDQEKSHVSIKLAVAEIGSPAQIELQQQIVGMLKQNGVQSVGMRFAQLPSQLVQEIQAEQTDINSQKLPTYIAVASGKGGVGKSTVSVNLAVSMARLGKKVGLLDADIYGFSVPDMMGITKRPEVVNDRIIPVERFGVQVISMGFFVEDNAPIIWRGPMLGKMLTSFLQEVEWGELDYLILDLPPGTGDIALDVHTMLPSSKEVIVTTPHPTAAFVAARAGAMAIKTEHEILGVIENMSYFESKLTGEKEYVFGKGGGKKLAEDLQTSVLGQLPLGQPDWDKDDFAPSVYSQQDRIGSIYIDIAKKVIEKADNV
ncbi:Mrp/NBP35 family ATP-binding protein [Niallia taxi]|uniref:Mrp/NBP35 family ATP-binding protein n=1 Tax=Niallia taxi TaxID=2499688 RepID=UPI00164234A6|nr:Mrp/NBP35 family ATP-binding protein [Niallia taxi]MCT2346533.1 Mrp/NBP35 family ATP-binding protein [Niallia taxi]MDE5055884.1 Mrp/NBP35 family ATP-binding protein [Niallia taxi]MED3965868.1 Mrp/NBP35 family ATP-binding protein [Niallia taxi]WOD64552.1 Mrp/NBP35 family ATP-binding protein [Niallia taxi]